MSVTAAQPPSGRLLPAPRPCEDGDAGFDPRDIASYYAFPNDFDGTGTTIAFVSLSGALRRPDVDTYFSAMPGAAPAIEVMALPAGCLSPVPAPLPGAGKAPAWDSRVGWGSPDGQRILSRLSAR
jgi:hypothetical protein